MRAHPHLALLSTVTATIVTAALALPVGFAAQAGSPPSGAAEKTVARSVVTLEVHPQVRIEGEAYSVRVAAQPATRRPVAIQRRIGGQWKTIAEGHTDRDGRMTERLVAPARSVRLRAKVPSVDGGATTYSVAASSTETVEVQRQRVFLTFVDDDIAEGEWAVARVRAVPVRPGRTVTMRVGNTVKTTTVDRRGKSEIHLKRATMSGTYRAVALPYRGAVRAVSYPRSLDVRDVTPPPVPYGLGSSPKDGAVSLYWLADRSEDFAGFRIWVRTKTTPWAEVATARETTALVTGLENGVEYRFAVSSADHYGNVSARSGRVRNTPTADAPAETGPGRP